MGIVQLMAPPGDPSDPSANADATNTFLDDNIRIYREDILVSGPDKIALLGWRGFPNADGSAQVDDFGDPITVTLDGDIRPAPTLLPVPFSTRTRLRSKWIDTGAADRRPLGAEDGNPRGIVEDAANGLVRGPTYVFAGTRGSVGSLDNGFADYVQVGGAGVEIAYPTPVAPVRVQAVDGRATHQGAPAYRVELAEAALGAIADRYSHYEAEIVDFRGSILGSYRILAHTDRELFLSPESGAMVAATDQFLRVRSKFFRVVTDRAEGLGGTYPGNDLRPVPVANVRVGFAFHQDPSNPNAQRYPANPTEFLFDVSNPAVQETIRDLHMTYVMWDVLVVNAFKANAADVPPGLAPPSPRPDLRYLLLQLRF
jgi:hypothetical protein